MTDSKPVRAWAVYDKRNKRVTPVLRTQADVIDVAEWQLGPSGYMPWSDLKARGLHVRRVTITPDLKGKE